MRWLNRVVNGLRALGRRQRHDAELDAELRSFVDASTEAKMRAGLPHDRARREAMLELGGLETVKEHVRDTGWETRAASLLQDVRYGFRVMRRTPAVTVAALLSLALGIGANTAIFSLFNALALRNLPVEHPGELRRIGLQLPSDSEPNPTFTNPLWELIRARQEVFSAAFAWGEERMDLATGGEAHYATTLVASGEFFDALGVRPAAGRVLHPADDARGCDGVAVLGYGFWRDQYGGDPNIVGRSLTLNRFTFPIVGVSQPGFTGINVGSKFDVAIPICSTARFDGPQSRLDHRSWWWLTMMARLKPGVSDAAATAQLAAISKGVMDAAVPPNWKPEMQARFRTRVLVAAPAASGLSTLRRRYTEPLRVLLGISALVLVIACANIAALMIARASTRRRELAVRLAIGASRGRLVRQLLTESALLTFIGAVGGLLVARWGSALLVQAISSRGEPVFLDLSLDARVLAFTTAVAVATGLLFGLWPALRATRADPVTDIKQGAVTAESGRRRRPGYWIAVGQMALCLSLVAVSGLLLRSFMRLVTVDLGFDRTGLLVASVAPRTPGAAGQSALYDDLQARLAALPGVVSVSRSLLSPLGAAQWDDNIRVEGPHRDVADADTMLNFVSADYFRTLRIPLRAGRDFTPAEAASGAPIAIINEAMAKKFFGDEPVLGRRIHLDPPRNEPARSLEIVGIVANARYSTLRGDFPATAYFPVARADGVNALNIELRVERLDPMALAPAVEREAVAVDRSLSLNFLTLDDQVDRNVRQERLLAVLSTFFGGLALVLAGIGLYGAIAYAVAARQKETGIRLALGASPRAIVGAVLGEVLMLVGAGLAIGIVIAIGAMRSTAAFLFELTPNDPATLIAACVALAIAGLVAGWMPASRAARADPLTSLRRD